VALASLPALDGQIGILNPSTVVLDAQESPLSRFAVSWLTR
jgi:hypothetical protein